MKLPEKEYEIKENGVLCTTFRQEVMHCIGLDNKKPYKRYGEMWYKPYRNWFLTTKPIPSWEQAVSEGLAIKDDRKPYAIEYHLTTKGLEWLGNEIGVNIKW